MLNRMLRIYVSCLAPVFSVCFYLILRAFASCWNCWPTLSRSAIVLCINLMVLPGFTGILFSPIPSINSLHRSRTLSSANEPDSNLRRRLREFEFSDIIACWTLALEHLHQAYLMATRSPVHRYSRSQRCSKHRHHILLRQVSIHFVQEQGLPLL